MKRTPLAVIVTILLATSPRCVAAAETNHNFARWEGEIKVFEASDRTNPPPKHGLLFTGSSTIRRWTTLAQDFPNQPVIGRGVGGAEIVDITHFADRIVLPYEPRMIFFRCGGNDITDGKSPEQVFTDFKEFVAAVRAKLPDVDIVFISWCATPTRWKQNHEEQAFNKLVRDYSMQAPHLKYCDASDISLGKLGQPRRELFVLDGIHFNAAGYKLLAERVRPFLPNGEPIPR
jgi:lysophospholipase L1-like esterase